VEIVVVELHNKPGELALITGILEKNGVNIDYMYGVDNSSETGLFAIKTDLNPDDLKNVLMDFTLH